MFTRKSWAVPLGAAMLAVAAAASAGAWSNTHQTTYVTFGRTVALPGIELGAGTYIFELAAPHQSPSLVRVLSRDRKKLYLTQFTLTVQRPANLDPQRMITFREAARDMPPPVDTWYPELSATGHQFIYR